MSKCLKCGRFISAIDAAKCSKCGGPYHRRCVALPASGAITPTWKCPDCKKNLALTGDSVTPCRTPEQKPADPVESPIYLSPPVSANSSNAAPAETAQDLTSDITSELRAFRDNLRLINNDLRLFRDEIAEVRASLHVCNSNITKLDERVDALERREPMDQASVLGVVAQLKKEINDRDQELLANDVEITNLPEAGGENPIHVIMQIAVKLGVKLDERDIVNAERVGPRYIVSTDAAGPERRPRPLVVRLGRRGLRDQLLSSARARRIASSADLGVAGPPRRFYINERLTKTNRHLFHLARDAGQRHGWKFVWVKRGRIYVRNNQGGNAFCLSDESDIERVFGCAQ